MSEQELGKCTVCGKDGVMMRKYYYYDINCDCCNGKDHFVVVRHHEDCVPKAPTTIRITLEMEASDKG